MGDTMRLLDELRKKEAELDKQFGELSEKAEAFRQEERKLIATTIVDEGFLRGRTWELDVQSYGEFTLLARVENGQWKELDKLINDGMSHWNWPLGEGVELQGNDGEYQVRIKGDLSVLKAWVGRLQMTVVIEADDRKWLDKQATSLKAMREAVMFFDKR